MHHQPKNVRALGLCSGGLDSMLAALVLRQQGIAVEWITFETPFFSADRARQAAQHTNIKLHVKDITKAYLHMLKNPPGGYGKYMNPCMDCHALMFRCAGELMATEGFDFLFSGEVLDQRPMSQTRPSLRYVEKHSGFDGYILRPLSALKLSESIPEKQGLVRREALLGISGRSRKDQIRLAQKLGITDYPSPAGGCLLTDKEFSLRLKDLFEQTPEPGERDLHLLKFGRHLRLNPKTKIVVGRHKEDNDHILHYFDAAKDTLIKVDQYPGPTTLIPHSHEKAIVALAAGICAGYSSAPENRSVKISITSPTGASRIKMIGIPPKEARRFMIGSGKG